MNLLAAMFCLGVVTILAQTVVIREVAVLCLGNELVIGLAVFIWLVLTGAGTWVWGKVFRKIGGGDPAAKARRLAGAFIWLALVLAPILTGLRVAGGWVRPAGEYAILWRVVVLVVMAFLPICLPAGGMFVSGCGLFHGKRFATSRVYACEALGSFAAGTGFSFYLAGRAGNLAVAGAGMVMAGIGALVMLGPAGYGRKIQTTGWVVLAAVILIGWMWLPQLDAWSTRRLWAGMGVIHDGHDGRPAVQLKGSTSTRYQDLTLTSCDGLFSLYGDGQIMGSFPDAVTAERQVAFVMAQNPSAKRVLLLGGNPAAELPFLLRYGVRQVVWVEQDPGVYRMLGRTVPAVVSGLEKDSRLRRVTDDGFRYVSRCRETFDIVLVHVPEPLTGMLNRYFTLEFYGNVRRILSTSGFMHTVIEGSELLEGEPSWMATTVYRTLRGVFPVVKVSAGPPMHCFASGEGGVLSFDREVLCRNITRSGVAFMTFNPVYLLDADELSPDKLAFVEQRLSQARVEVNTVLNPSSWFYTLLLWSRYSGSPAGSILKTIRHWTWQGWAAGIALMTLLLLLVMMRVSRRDPVMAASLEACQAMAVSGFTGVALELVLLYSYQVFYGHVYVRMSFMIGLFMLGTVLGSLLMGWWKRAEPHRVVMGCLGALGLQSAVVAGCLVVGIHSEGWLYGMTTLVGVLVGLQFVATGMRIESLGVDPSKAAGQVWLCDYWGSACGGLLTGGLLVIVLGLGGTCLLLAIVPLCSLLVVAAAYSVRSVSPRSPG